MTRWAMVADLNRCVGCQTCTSACKHANATAPGVQWRQVLDFEAGTYPKVARSFMPVGCMHCEDPPCMHVCPSTATGQRDDGIVTIDYDLCIGCSYCAVACPYQARWRVDEPSAAFGNKPMPHEKLTENSERLGVAQKCTFCVERIDEGLAAGLTPGVDHEATPVCVTSCIADALHFGDIENEQSNISTLLANNKHFGMHESLGTGPGFFYLWDRGQNDDEPLEPAEMVASPAGMASVSPTLQKSWDWRAAANFIGGGTGTGLLIVSAMVGLFAPQHWLVSFLALAMVALGLFCVWLEIGRPWRFLHVYFNSRTSWMTREAIVAMPLFAFGLGSMLFGWPVLGLATAIIALTFMYCQGQMLFASKGIPAWRQPKIVALIMATGMVEGLGLFLAFAVISGAATPILQGVAFALMVAIALRYFAWANYRRVLGQEGAPTKTLEILDDTAKTGFGLVPQLIIIGIVVVALLSSLPMLMLLAGSVAVADGWRFKLVLITKAAYNQGFALTRMPARGAGKSSPGIQPGWTKS